MKVKNDFYAKKSQTNIKLPNNAVKYGVARQSSQSAYSGFRPKSDIEDYESVNPQYISMFRKSKEVNLIDVYLDDHIREVSYYRPMLHVLYELEEHDQMRLWLDGPGGLMDTAMSIVQAMNESDGKVCSIVTGWACSAHSMIALCSPGLILGENAKFFLHSASYNYGGKQQEVASFHKFMDSNLTKVIRKVYTGFLTDAEMQALQDGKDYYFDGEELEKRVESRYEYLESLKEEDNTDDEPNNSSDAL